MTPITQHTTAPPKIKAVKPKIITPHMASASCLRSGSASIYCSIL